jgi:hypothetical protein
MFDIPNEFKFIPRGLPREQSNGGSQKIDFLSL